MGFGTMRFPLNQDGRVDTDRAVDMLRAGIDGGINYVDTAYLYHDGESERIVGKALEDGYREKVYLATKSPVWMIEKEADFDRYLEDQLQKLQTDHIDFYLLHALNRERLLKHVKPFHLIDKLLEAKRKGKVRWIGFSFHDTFSVFEEIINMTDQWDFCQIQYNYIDVDERPGTRGLQLAAERGLGVVIMEPLLGGRLAEPAPHVRRCLTGGRSPVESAFDFLWNKPEVSLLLSGMSDEKQVEENLIYAGRSCAGMLEDEEMAGFTEAKRVFDRMALIPCTGCRYCMPCPFGLDIPEIFHAYNMSASVGTQEAKEAYGTLHKKAADCRACRQCEKECPQQIAVSSSMEQVTRYFTTT